MSEEKLKLLREKLIRKYNSVRKSMKNRLSYDIGAFNGLVYTLGMDDLIIPVLKGKDVELKDTYQYKIMENMYELELIADTVIDMYKDMDFEFYGRRGIVNLSLKEKKEIFQDFLNSFCPQALKLYQTLYKEGRVFFADLEWGVGESFNLRNFDEYFLAININEHNTLTELETFVHELMHIYVEKFLSDYRWEVSNLAEGLYLETIPLYTERELYLFLKKNGLYNEEVLFQENDANFLLLQWFKVIKYIAEMDKRVENWIMIHNDEYKVQGNTHLEGDEGTIYAYSENYKSGSLHNVKYAISSIDAFKLLEQSQSGEKNVVDKYILSLLNKNKLQDDFQGIYDLTFMRNSIFENTQELKKRIGNK